MIVLPGRIGPLDHEEEVEFFLKEWLVKIFLRILVFLCF